MVDFNNESTITIPATNIVKILILQARYNLFESLEFYTKQHFKNIEADISYLRSRLITLFFEIQAFLDRVNKDKDGNINPEYSKVRGLILNIEQSLNYSEIIDIITFLNNTLDDLKLTKIDFIMQYNSDSLEDENKHTGY